MRGGFATVHSTCLATLGESVAGAGVPRYLQAMDTRVLAPILAVLGTGICLASAGTVRAPTRADERNEAIVVASVLPTTQATTTAAEPVDALAVAAPTTSQKPKPDVCPWCKGDAEAMAKAGVVSHGPVPIATWTSDQLVSRLPASQWIVLETAHLRFASSLPAIEVELADQARVQAELDRLRAVLPNVPAKVKKLDPWLRLHLIAMKSEEFHARFQKLIGVTDADFPESRQHDKPYMGDGKFLGEKDKFEIVLHANRATHNLFTKDFCGAEVTGALRWHFPKVHKMLASIPCEDPDLKKDKTLYPHVVHNLSHLFFCAYKHFSYDPPTWIDEGIALAMEKEIDPRAATNEGEEGSFVDRVAPPNWGEEVRKMIGRGRQKSLAELMYVKETGAMDPDALYTSWSMTRFLIEEHPEKLATILGGLKGQLDANGIPTGDDLPGLQRRLFKDVGGWTPQSFDEQWKAWATRPPPPPAK